MSGPLLRAVLGAIALLALAQGPASAEGARAKPRIASINMCTDQLLVAIADPDQIVGLGPFARDAVRAWAADRAENLPVFSGFADELLVTRPDIVLGGRFTRRATMEVLRAQGFRIESFDPAVNFDQVREQIRRVGALTGHPERAEAHVAALDAAIEETRAAFADTGLRVLPLQRRGWAAGRNSLITELLELVGANNAAAELGLTFGAQVKLEQVVKLRPDALLVSSTASQAEDQGRALLLHPAIAELYPPEKRLVMPERLTVCGGPMLAEALRVMASEVRRVAAR